MLTEREVSTVVSSVAEVIRPYVERKIDGLSGQSVALNDRLKTVETDLAALPTTEFVRAEINGAKSALALDLLGALSKSTDGKTITVEDVKPLVESLVSAIPAPKDGADGKDGRDGTDGKSVDPVEVKAMVDETVTRAAANLLAAQPVIDDEMKAFADAITMRFTAAAIA